jgi:hypothetical protein
MFSLSLSCMLENLLFMVPNVAPALHMLGSFSHLSSTNTPHVDGRRRSSILTYCQIESCIIVTCCPLPSLCCGTFLWSWLVTITTAHSGSISILVRAWIWSLLSVGLSIRVLALKSDIAASRSFSSKSSVSSLVRALLHPFLLYARPPFSPLHCNLPLSNSPVSPLYNVFILVGGTYSWFTCPSDLLSCPSNGEISTRRSISLLCPACTNTLCPCSRGYRQSVSRTKQIDALTSTVSARDLCLCSHIEMLFLSHCSTLTLAWAKNLPTLGFSFINSTLSALPLQVVSRRRSRMHVLVATFA